VERRARPLLRRLRLGAGAGVAGTVVMSGVMLAADRFGRLGLPPPQAISEQTMQLASGARPAASTGRALGLVAHLGFGAAGGAAYALLPRVLGPDLRGLGWGLLVYAVSYQGWVPAMGALPPATRDRRDRVAVMIFAHAVYGSVLGRAEQALRQRSS